MKYGGLKIENPRGISGGESPDCRNEIIKNNQLHKRTGIAKNFTTALSSPINYMFNPKSGFCKENYKLVITRDGTMYVSSLISKTWTSKADWESGTRSQVITDIDAGDMFLDLSGTPETTLYELASLPESASVVGYWKMEDTAGVILDETANNHDGNYDGALYRQDGKIGKSLGFNGSNIVRVPYSTDFYFSTGDFTVAFWMYPTTTGSPDFLVGRSYALNNPLGWDLRHNTSIANKIDVIGVEAWAVDITSSVSVLQDTWSFIVLTGTATTGTLYINGLADGTCGRRDMPDSASQLEMASTTGLGLSDFAGSLDEVIIWKGAALTAAQVRSLYGHYTNGNDLLQYDSGSSSTDWTTYSFIADETPTGTNIKIRCKSASSQAGLASATWGSWLDATSGSLDCDNNRWIEIEVYLETTNVANTPTLSDLGIAGRTPIGG